jgi:hypothetical protein
MKRIARLFAVAACLWSGVLPAQPAPLAPAAAPREDPWRPYQSDAGRFKVEFPVAPLRKEGRRRTESGEVGWVRFTATDSAEATYDVTYNDYPESVVAKLSQAKLLGAAKDGLVYQSKGHLAGERPFRMGKVSGSDLEIAGGDGMHYLVRMFLVGNRLYQLTAMARPPAKPEIDRFFSSFQLTSPARSAP